MRLFFPSVSFHFLDDQIVRDVRCACVQSLSCVMCAADESANEKVKRLLGHKKKDKEQSEHKKKEEEAESSRINTLTQREVKRK